ncbi:LytR C-terminal domain-containing protein [Blastococcus haudaquaticus]|uniref:LytR cell envelope-related transcriptional attenuator n=1 Tax=Blastococcus haudaquaticus TaxID=1938745 RepID=A0A286H047_9ACTN|nr:LytR C-terminal domain-containing protein [Blastococcus haudaquaticus]SOE00826.1 LytR cell envelope-related transcriptional attenuator [Blastococcus haudaquaticus]
MPAPSTSVAPFQAVPAPEPRLDLSADDAFLPASPAAARGDLLERPARVQPAPVRPSRSRPDVEPSFASTGPAGRRPSGPAPRVPSQTTAAGSSSSAYGDWTRPSRDGEGAFGTDPELLADVPSAPVAAPGTTAIPERSVRRRRSADVVVEDAPVPVAGPGTGPVGGRAAMRAERQAADAVRRKAEGHKGSAVAVLEEDEPRRPRRVLKGLVAMTVVALGVLGVYSYVSPETKETAAQSPSGVSTTAPEVPDVASLPELPADPIAAEPVAASPIRVPVTVLNSTDITGLAAKVAGAVAAGGWETPAVGGYTAGDVAASTVFFTEGDENQRQAAVQLIEMYPQLQGPTPRFFELPADVQAPGLVLVTTGDWQP